MFWIIFAILATANGNSIANVSKDFNFDIPKDFNASDDILSDMSDDIANAFTKEYFDFHRTGIESPALRRISTQLANMHSEKDIFIKDVSELSVVDSFFLCTACRSVARIAAQMVREEGGELTGPNANENAKQLTLEFCRRLKIQTEEVCLGAAAANWPIIQYIVMNTKADSRTFCSLFMGKGFCKSSKNPEYDFTITLDTSRDLPSEPKKDMPQSNDNGVAVLHISDIHYDPLYVPGALAECEEPLCCHKNVEEENTSTAAGYWGDYRDCDAPLHMIENALEHIKNTHKRIDYIYQTGDGPSHMVWNLSREKNMEILEKIDDVLEKKFPGIQVFPCVGNHESHPVNVFSPEDAPDEFNTKWLYEFLYKSWSRWLPENTKETILKGGYYTVSPKSGFRIIALNNNDCINMNWWLFYEGQNKKPQLEWLHDTLLAAESANEYVHILTHIPTGQGSCWSVWSREFDRIVVRFSHVISGIFNGHTHKDEIYMHYTSEGNAVNVAWNGGSITPASNKNPNYRFYHLDEKNMQVANAKTWTFNLVEANRRGAENVPEWYEMYDFRKEFTTDLSPYGIDQLLNQFAENPNMLRKYWKYLSTEAEPQMNTGCDRNCLMNTICRIATGANDQLTRCLALQEVLKKSLDAEDATSTTTTATTTTTTSTTLSSAAGGSTESTTVSTTAKPGNNGSSTLAVMILWPIMLLYVVLNKLIF